MIKSSPCFTSTIPFFLSQRGDEITVKIIFKIKTRAAAWETMKQDPLCGKTMKKTAYVGNNETRLSMWETLKQDRLCGKQ